MTTIELDGVSKWYGEVIGLNKVTAAVGGGITGLLGPNGAGKSTLMGLATGQLRCSQGRIRVLDQPVWNNPQVLSRIGYCPEGDRFWPQMTGLEFVRFLARCSGLHRAAAKKAAADAIELTGMTEHMHRRIKGYSKGMRQRIKISQALVHKPALLLLDEPFTGADPVARHSLAELFRSLAAQGVHMLVASHVLHEVEALTQRILMIRHGCIVAQGELQDVRRQMRDRPHAVRIRADQPRRLAAGIVEMDAVTGLRWLDDDTLIVHTTAPQSLHDRLTRWVLDHQLIVREITPEDESLEAVFGYLTNRRM